MMNPFRSKAMLVTVLSTAAVGVLIWSAGLHAYPSGGRGSRQCSYTLKLNKKKFEHLKPIILNLSFRNLGSDALKIRVSGFWIDHMVVVLDEHSEKVPLTPLGAQRLKDFAPEGSDSNRNIMLTIEPYDVLEEGYTINLYDNFLLEPGKYKVQVTYDNREGPTPLTLRTKFVPFEITPKRPGRPLEKGPK